jgi:hypothetical protein
MVSHESKSRLGVQVPDRPAGAHHTAGRTVEGEAMKLTLLWRNLLLLFLLTVCAASVIGCWFSVSP